jgi:hypothetical protein
VGDYWYLNAAPQAVGAYNLLVDVDGAAGIGNTIQAVVSAYSGDCTGTNSDAAGGTLNVQLSDATPPTLGAIVPSSMLYSSGIANAIVPSSMLYSSGIANFVDATYTLTVNAVDADTAVTECRFSRNNGGPPTPCSQTQ